MRFGYRSSGLTNLLYSIKLDEAVAKAKERVAKFYNIPKDKLTTYYRIRDLGYLISQKGYVGKILGAFFPYSRDDEIHVDPMNFERGGLLEVLVHELAHKVQKIKGIIYRLARRRLEEEAYSDTRKIMKMP